MFVEKEFFVGLRDLEDKNKLSNTALLSYLEDMGGIHSNLVGNGLNDINTVKHTWILLAWKVKLFNRPKYADKIRVKTWSRKMDKIYAFRDFEIYDEQNNIIGIATSKWIYMNIDTWKITKTDKALEEKYGTEVRNVFEEEDIEKLKEPEAFTKECEYLITKDMIDINKHVHNIYYLDIASEVLPEEVYNQNQFNNFQIMYKKEIKCGEKVKVLYTAKENKHIIVIKSNDEKELHAIIEMY